MPENARLNPAKLGKMFQLEIKIELKYSEISNKIRETSIDTISYSKGLLKSCLSFFNRTHHENSMQGLFLNKCISINIHQYIRTGSLMVCNGRLFLSKELCGFFYPNMGNTHEILNVHSINTTSTGTV